MASDDEFDIPQASDLGTTFSQRLVYLVNSFAVSALPLYLFFFIKEVEVNQTNLGLFFVVAVVNTFVLSGAYSNKTYSLKKRLVESRESSITFRSVKEEVGKDAKGKKNIVRARKEAQAAVTNMEAVANSVLFNNVFNVLFNVIFSVYILRSFESRVAFVASTAFTTVFQLYVTQRV